MKLLLLVVIYVVFVSLGLPDGILGSAWPAIHESVDAPLALGGLFTAVGIIMTTVSSLLTTQLVRRIGIGWLVTVSVLLTSLALLGLSQSHHVVFVFLFAIPLGLGGGAIDTALNHYAAHNYRASHMNWLHAFWGVGAMLGPLAFAAALVVRGDWHAGFFVLAICQFIVVILLLVGLRLWKSDEPTQAEVDAKSPARLLHVFMRENVQLSALAFFLYVGLEVIVGFWLASYLVAVQGFDLSLGAVATGLYFGAIMTGRIVAGFLTYRHSDARLIRLGILLALVGAVLLGYSISPAVSLAGVLLIGFGFAPIYPNLIHATPKRFKGISSQVMSIQMAAGYIGAALLAPLVGLFEAISGSLNVFIVVLAVILSALWWVYEALRRRPTANL